MCPFALAPLTFRRSARLADWRLRLRTVRSGRGTLLTEPYLCSATAGVGTLELECRPQRAKDVMKAMFVAMRFGLG